MKKLFLKTLMTALVLLTGGVSSAWAADALTASLKVAGYSKSHFFDFVARDFDGTSYTSNDDLPGLGVTAQITVQEAYETGTWYYYNGLRNQAGGGRWIQFPAEIKADDYIIINGAAASEAYEISMTDGTSTTITGASDYLCFKADKDMSALKLTVHRYNYISQILIMTKDASAATADYTITYMYGSETVKTSTGNAVVGSGVVTEASFFVDGVKYFRADGEEENFTIESSGNEFTVDVRQAETYGYTLLSSLGTTISMGSGFEGETVSVGYPRYQLQGTDIYEADATNKEYRKSIALTENNVSATVTYTKKTENVVFYAEAETVDGFTVSTAGNIPGRASNALAAIASEDVTITTLSAGKYIIHAGAFTSRGSSQTIYIGYGETQIGFSSASNLNESASEEIVLTESTDIKYFGTTSSGDAQFDYVWIEKTGDLEDEALATAKEELLIAITYAESIEADELADAIGDAQAAYEDTDATAESVNQATAALVLAVKQYAKGALQTVLELAEEMSNNSGELDEEIQEFKTELDGAIEAANAALNDDEKTPEDIMSALDELSNAALVFASVTLDAAIEAAYAIYDEDKNGAEELADAIQAAEAAFAEESIQGFYQAGLALKQAIDDFNAANEPTFAITDYLINADFSSTEGWTAYASGANGTNYQDYNNGLIGTYQVRFSPATVDDTHLATEYCFGFECRWQTNYSSFNQETIEELPAGEYTLTFDVENVNGSTTKATYNNLFYVKVGETTYADNSREWMDGKSSWTTHTIEFTLAEPAKATVSFGYGTGSNNFGANNTPALYVSHLALSYKSLEEIAAEELAEAKEVLQDEIETAESYKTEARTEGLNDYEEAIAAAESAKDATTTDEVTQAIATLQVAETTFLTANLPVAEGTYYIFNPKTKMFLARGNAWGTSAVVGNYGVAVNVACVDLPEGKYTLTGFDNNTTYGDDTWMYADAGGDRARTYIITKSGAGFTMTNTNNNQLVYVSLADGGDKYRVAGNAIKGENYTDDAQTIWKFITPDKYDEMMAQRTAAEKTAVFEAAGIAEDAEVVVGEPVELTFASGHGWTQTVVREQKDQPATNGNGTEMWQATGYYTQTVSDLPSGLYKVSIQAFYRNGGADECVTRYNTGYNTVLAYLDANGCIAQVKSWAEDKGEGNDPNDMGQAKAKFDDGKYVSETYAYVGNDGKLNLTVYNPAHIGNGWFIVGNVKYAAVTLPAEPDVVITAIDAPELLASGFSSEVTVTVSSAIDIENAVVTLLLGDTEAGTSEPVNIAAGEEVPISMMVDVAYGNPDDYLLSATLIYDDLEGDPIGCADEVKQTVRVTCAGDPNGDFEVTVSDAALTVMFALGTQEPTETQFRLADMNESGDITVSDAVAVVNKASGLIFARESERSTTQGANYLTQDGTEIGLVNTTDFVGFQMDVTLSDGAVLNGVRLTERASGLQLFTSRIDQNTWRIIALSLDGTVISGNEGTLLSLNITGNGQASFSRIEFTDTAAQAHQLGFGSPTGINVLYNNKVDGEVYTLGGTRTGNLKKGVNVVRQADGQVRKVLVK